MDIDEQTTKYCEFLDDLITSPETDTLFQPKGTPGLREKLVSHSLFSTLAELGNLNESVNLRAESFNSWETHAERWQLLLVLLGVEELREEVNGKKKEGEEQKEEDEEEEEEDDDDDDDEGGAEAKAVEKMLAQLGPRFTYIPQIKMFTIFIINSTLDNSPIASKQYNLGKAGVDKTKAGFRKFKAVIQACLNVVGLCLSFWNKLMQRWKMIEIPSRIIGTILVILLGAFVYFIVLLKWISNPLNRLIRWLSREFEMDIGDDDDEIIG